MNADGKQNLHSSMPLVCMLCAGEHKRTALAFTRAQLIGPRKFEIGLYCPKHGSMGTWVIEQAAETG